MKRTRQVGNRGDRENLMSVGRTCRELATLAVGSIVGLVLLASLAFAINYPVVDCHLEPSVEIKKGNRSETPEKVLDQTYEPVGRLLFEYDNGGITDFWPVGVNEYQVEAEKGSFRARCRPEDRTNWEAKTNFFGKLLRNVQKQGEKEDKQLPSPHYAFDESILVRITFLSEELAQVIDWERE